MTKALLGVVRTIKAKATCQPGEPMAGDDETGVSTRRRGQDLETAILDATLDLLGTVGIGGLTMEGVAAAAHTGKASVYRRWRSKEDLLVDAIRRALPPLDVEPDTGSVRDDLIVLLQVMAASASSRNGCALAAFMFDTSTDRELINVIKKRAMEPRDDLVVKALARGRDRGEVRPSAVTTQTAEVGPALIVHKYLMDGPPVTDDYVVDIVDNVLMPLLRP